MLIDSYSNENHSIQSIYKETQILKKEICWITLSISTMWKCVGISESRTLDKATSNFSKNSSLQFQFRFSNFVNLFIYVLTFCICWHSADEWCIGRASRNRTVQIILFWQIKCETCGELFQSIINLLFHVEVSTLKQFILCVINILSEV